MLKPQIKSVINMKTTSMRGSKEQTSRKGAHQNTLNRFGTGDFLECSCFAITSMVTSLNAGFWPVWNIYQLNLEMKKKQIYPINKLIDIELFITISSN